jgi:putative membrane protein
MKKYSRADTFFTGEEKARIANTTREVEARSIGEVAVMVVESSDPYIDAEVIGGISLGSFIALVLAEFFFHASLWSYIPLSFLFFFPSKYLFQIVPVMKTAFIGVKRKELTVMQRAMRAFYEKGLYKTKKNTGVLFFLSLLERKVWVLADIGINEKIDQATPNRFANLVSQGIKDGNSCEALCAAIKEAGDLLEKHFPITPGDTDELPDEVMTE